MSINPYKTLFTHYLAAPFKFTFTHFNPLYGESCVSPSTAHYVARIVTFRGFITEPEKNKIT